MIEFLFLDLDDTILDFHKAERLAIAKTFREFGLEPTDAVLNRYHEINKLHWQRLERGEITRDHILESRFPLFFKELGVEGDGLAAETISDCDYTVKIPMSHGVDSLNVAAASAVAFWEFGNKCRM